MISTYLVTTANELASYRPAWKRLVALTPEDGTRVPAWYDVVEQADAGRLRLVVATLGSEVIGMLPLIVQERPTPLGRVRVLTPLCDEAGSFGPVGRYRTMAWLGAMHWLSENAGLWDAFEARWSDGELVHQRRLRSAARQAGLKVRQADHRLTLFAPGVRGLTLRLCWPRRRSLSPKIPAATAIERRYREPVLLPFSRAIS